MPLRVSGTCQSGKSSGADLRKPSSCLYSSQRPSLHTLLSPSGYPGTAGGRDPRAPPAQGMWDGAQRKLGLKRKQRDGAQQSRAFLGHQLSTGVSVSLVGVVRLGFYPLPHPSHVHSFLLLLSNVCHLSRRLSAGLLKPPLVEGKHTHPSGVLLLLHWATKLT